VDDDATVVLEYPDGTAIIGASWDWPYSKDVVAVYGPKGSLLARHSTLQRRLAETRGPDVPPDGESLTLEALPKERSNPISYFVDCIRNDKAIEDPLSARLNVSDGDWMRRGSRRERGSRRSCGDGLHGVLLRMVLG